MYTVQQRGTPPPPTGIPDTCWEQSSEVVFVERYRIAGTFHVSGLSMYRENL